MIRINLLPHREEKRKARRHQFFALAGLLSVLAGVIWFLGYSIINGYISAQMEKNAFLEKEIDVLKKDIEEIAKLKEQTEALLKRKQVIESLQGNRAATARMFDELLRRVPDGVRLVTLSQSGDNFDVTGESVSEARVSSLMRNLEDSSMFKSVNPIEIRAITASNGRQLFSFQLKMSMERPTPPKDGKEAPPKGSAEGGGKK